MLKLLKLLQSVLLICLYHAGYSQLACIQVSSVSCPDIDGIYYLSTDSVWYNEIDKDISYSTAVNRPADGWYLDRSGPSNNPFYNPTSDNQNLPLTGWRIYQPCNGETFNEPADLVIQFVACQRTQPCFAVSTNCENLGGIYQQSTMITYNGLPVYFDEDGNEIYSKDPNWYIYGGSDVGDDYENISTSSTLPLDGWASVDPICDPHPISVSQISCPSDVVPTLSEWGIIILGIFLAIVGAIGFKSYYIERRLPS